MRDKISFMIAGSEVTRYHTVRTLQIETVGHHSHGVAMFCTLITKEPSANLLKAALFHDLAEHQLGDIPSPAKKKYGIGEQVNELENALLDSHQLSVELTKEEARILKLADIFQGMMFCLRELELGNGKMREIFERYRSYAEDMVLVGYERWVYSTIIDMLKEQS